MSLCRFLKVEFTSGLKQGPSVQFRYREYSVTFLFYDENLLDTDLDLIDQ